MYAHDRSHHQQQLAGRANLPVLAQRVPSTSSKIMRWYRVLLVVASTLLAGSDAATKSVQAKMSALDSTASVSAAVVARYTIRQRFLRMDTSTPDAAKTSSYSFKDIDAEGDDATGDSAFIDSEDRAGGGAMESLKSLKSFKALSRSMSKASKKFSDKISPALPMKTKLRVWSDNEKPLSFVKKELGMNHLPTAELMSAQNYKYYDDFVTSQLPIWAKKELTPDEVMELLELKQLSGTTLTSNPNFKYYDEYVGAQVLVWGKKDLSVGDVLARLDLSRLTGAARTEAVNYKYFNAFVVNQLHLWLQKDLPVDDVMMRLSLDKLSGDDLLAHPNYPYYKSFVINKLKSWGTDGASPYTVAKRLGLEQLRGQTLERHPNYYFLVKYEKNRSKYQLDGWLKQRLSTYDIWERFGLETMRPTLRRNSRVYEVYKNYVNTIDKHIISLKEDGFPYPDLTSKNPSISELREKTLIWTSAKRPEWYVKFSLGLEGLDETALKQAPNYIFFEYYQEGIKHIQ